MEESNYIALSHRIDEKTPSYGNQGGFTRTILSAIKEGRTANSEEWTLNNHLGTHIDFPKHFDDKGKTSSQYEHPFFIYEQVGYIELSQPTSPGQLIGTKEISPHLKSISKNVEIILLKTHFEQHRSQKTYWKDNPGYHEDLANLFRNEFPQLKAFGFDSISLTSLHHRAMGGKSHRAFLMHKNPILIIEDMALSQLEKEMKFGKMILAQFPVANADGTPVNCLLEKIS